ncbi:MAG: cupin domain-containing protein [Actinobacteria bacterium]|nr:cupin domain-containing protein [Actinomycetota bacterium]
MVERVQTRPREAADEAGEKYTALMRDRSDFVERQRTAPLVVKAPKKDEYELCPQGLIGWYLHPQVFTDRCLDEWYVFIHDIRGVSGRHRHQGGLVLFIIEGQGYSTMNGVRYDWKEGDLVLMPLLPEQVEHQHFNLRPDRPSKWMAFIHLPTFNNVGSELTQKAIDPEWAERSGQTTWRGANVAEEKVTGSS